MANIGKWIQMINKGNKSGKVIMDQWKEQQD